MTDENLDAATSVEAEMASEKMPEAVEINPTELLHQSVQTEKDRALRAMAELENFKRRKEQEVEQFKRFAKEKSVVELLPILDSFDRACAHLDGQTAADQEQVSGFLLIQKQFHHVLEKWGVTPIETEGQAFDPHLHQAVMETESETVAPGMIAQEMQKGYKLHDRVIRPAMVAVAKA